MKALWPWDPSPHAVPGTLFAQILVQFRPDRADAIRDRGRQLGSDRVMAGQRLGKAFAAGWIAKPGNRQRIIQVCGAERQGGEGGSALNPWSQKTNK